MIERLRFRSAERGEKASACLDRRCILYRPLQTRDDEPCLRFFAWSTPSPPSDLRRSKLLMDGPFFTWARKNGRVRPGLSRAFFAPCLGQGLAASRHGARAKLPPLFLQVIIFGHSPPGKFERDYSSTGHHWLDHASNRRFVHFVRTFSDVIVGQFFGHQHTDSFRLFKDVGGEKRRCRRRCPRNKTCGGTGKATLHKTAAIGRHKKAKKERRKEGRKEGLEEERAVLMENPCRSLSEWRHWRHL